MIRDIFHIKELKLKAESLKSEKKLFKSIISEMIEFTFKNRNPIDLCIHEQLGVDRHLHLDVLFTNKKSYAEFLSKFRLYINDIFEVIKHLKEENKALIELNNKYKKALHSYLTEYIEEKEIDVNKFNTNEFKCRFLSYQIEEHSDREALDKFNELLNKEKIYLDGIISCLDFCLTKRNKSMSIEKQLRKYLLTEYGKETVEMILDNVYKEGNNNV